MKFAVIKTGGKQYFVKKDDEIIVDNLNIDHDVEIEFETLAEGDDEKHDITLGKPYLAAKVRGKVMENLKGDKIRVTRYKAKVRSRKVRGFRQSLTKVKITSI